MDYKKLSKVADKLQEQIADKSHIVDMAIAKSKFIELLESHEEQLVQNLCLVFYAKRTNHINLNHWKAELCAYMERICTTKLKSNNSTDSRIKLITKVYHNMYECDTNIDRIQALCTRKFYQENIDIDSPIVSQCFSDCMQVLPNVYLVLAQPNLQYVKQFIIDL